MDDLNTCLDYKYGREELAIELKDNARQLIARINSYICGHRSKANRNASNYEPIHLLTYSRIYHTPHDNGAGAYAFATADAG